MIGDLRATYGGKHFRDNIIFDTLEFKVLDGKTLMSFCPFTYRIERDKFKDWADECLEGEWFFIDAYRVAIRSHYDIVLAYLRFQ